ncbi:hypothetical protein D3C79_1008130 [compost metagenome]
MIVIVVDNNVAAVFIGQYAAHPYLAAESTNVTQIQQRRQQLACAPCLIGRQRAYPGFDIFTRAGAVIR